MDEDSFAAVMKKTMMWAVHPEEDRCDHGPSHTMNSNKMNF